ncbi:MAG: alpha/beta hydrolase [Desulfovibrio sp.]|jgi:haloacetate dehalogenase|nr:alpha/beta hydrolase [Desulfovibrio sp.]
MFEGFTKEVRDVSATSVCFRKGGKGPGLLLLHGHPQTHVLWHKVAPDLARHFTVVAADLRGYGDSGKPDPDPEHLVYSKREMSKDLVELMTSLGFDEFIVLAHDRGARVAHRLGMDHGGRVKRMVLLDIAPTLDMYAKTDLAFAKQYWHWFYLILPAPLPELTLQNNPDCYMRTVMGRRSAGMAPFTEEALAEYVRCLALPGTARGICEDYRASATIDLVHDQEDRDAGRKLEMPVLALWGGNGVVGKLLDPLEAWRNVAGKVDGGALDCGHYIAEEAPGLLLERALPFLKG